MDNIKTILAGLSLTMAVGMPAVASDELTMVVGTYTDQSTSDGMYVYRFNQRTGKSQLVSNVQAGNPSFLMMNHDANRVYAVSEYDDMDGNKWRLFCLAFSFIGWELLCALPMYVGYFLFLHTYTGSDALAVSIVLLLAVPLSAGFFFVRPYEEAAWAIFYRDITAAPAEPEATD